LTKATKETGYLEATGPGGEKIRVPVATVRGPQDGPTLLVVAGVHGSEYDGIEATKRLFRSVDENALSGTLVTVPCLNVPAFYGLAMHVNPIDGENPARVFPGRSDGGYTERMVDLVWSKLAASADFIVDVHGGDLEEELVEYSQINLSGNAEVDAAAAGLALALDLPFYVRRAAPAEPVSTGTICQAAAAAGIPAVLAEAGSHGIVDERCIATLLKGLRNVLHHLDMLPGVPTIEHPQPMLLHRFAGVAAPVDGFWYPTVKKGDVIQKGQALGEMRDFFGETLSLVVSEENAAILGVMTIPPRRQGEMLMGIGTLD
jgi:predicted deacylase